MARKNYLIGVGGTGARCVEAVIRLLSLGVGQGFGEGGTELDPIKVMVIDSDQNNWTDPILAAVSSYNTYRDILRKSVTPDLDGQRTFPQRRPLQLVSQNEVLFGLRKRFPTGIEPSLNNLFNDPNRAPLFLREDQLHIDSERGLYGEPALGACIFSLLADQAAPGGDAHHPDLFARFLSQLRMDLNQGPVTVLLTGSIFGGTGSSGVPHLVRLLRNQTQGNPQLNIGTVLLAPYFCPNPPTNPAHAQYAHLADSRAQREKAAQILEDFQHGHGCDRVLVLGEQTPHPLDVFAPDAVAAAGAKQTPYLPLEIVAASSLLEFVESELNQNLTLNRRSLNLHETTGVCHLARRRDAKWDDLPGGPRQRIGFELQLSHTMRLARGFVASVKDPDWVKQYCIWQDACLEWFDDTLHMVNEYQTFWKLTDTGALLKDLLWKQESGVKDPWPEWERLATEWASRFTPKPDSTATQPKPIDAFLGQWGQPQRPAPLAGPGVTGDFPLLPATQQGIAAGTALGTFIDPNGNFSDILNQVEPNPRQPGLYHPTLWARGTRTLLDLAAPGPDQNEWEALIVGLALGRFLPAKVGVEPRSNIRTNPEATADCHRQLPRTNPPGMAPENSVDREFYLAMCETAPRTNVVEHGLVWAEIQGEVRWFGVMDERCVAWLPPESSRKALWGLNGSKEICLGHGLSIALDDVGTPRLNLDWGQLTPEDKAAVHRFINHVYPGAKDPARVPMQNWRVTAGKLLNVIPGVAAPGQDWWNPAGAPGAAAFPHPMPNTLHFTDRSGVQRPFHLKPGGRIRLLPGSDLPENHPWVKLAANALDLSTLLEAHAYRFPAGPGRTDAYRPLKPKALELFAPENLLSYFGPLLPRPENPSVLCMKVSLPTSAGTNFEFEVDYPQALQIDFSATHGNALRMQIWPSFVHSMWNYYLIQIQEWPTAYPAPQVKPWRYQPGIGGVAGTAVEMASLAAKPSTYESLAAWPDLLAFASDGQPCGVFLALPDQELNNVKPFDALSLDLGSANTTMAFRDQPGGTVESLNFNMHEGFTDTFGTRRHPFKLLMAIQDANAAEKRDNLHYRTLGLDLDADGIPAAGPVSEIPSFLIAAATAPPGTEPMRYPLLKAQPARFPNLHMRHGGGPNWIYLDDLKWSPLNGAVKSYAEFLRRLAQVRLSIHHGALVFFNRTIVTFPWSMTDPAPYLGQLQAGMVPAPIACSESLANLKYLSTCMPPADQFRFNNAYALVLDMGGGTTDLSLAYQGAPVALLSLGPDGPGGSGAFGGRALANAIFETLKNIVETPANWPHSIAHRRGTGYGLVSLMEDCLQDLGWLDGTAITVPPGVQVGPRLTQALDVLLAQKICGLVLTESATLKARILLLNYLVGYYAALQVLAEATRQQAAPAESLEVHLLLPGSGWQMSRFAFDVNGFTADVHFGPLLQMAYSRAQATTGVPNAATFTIHDLPAGSRKQSVSHGAIAVVNPDWAAQPGKPAACLDVCGNTTERSWSLRMTPGQRLPAFDMASPIPDDADVLAFANAHFLTNPPMVKALRAVFTQARGQHANALACARAVGTGPSPLAAYLRYLNLTCIQSALSVAQPGSATPFD